VEGVFELPGGCLCCMVREDLAQTLRGLIDRRDAGALKPFRRLVVETTGLADPGPILYTLGADPMLDQRLSLMRVVTVIDAVTGAATLDRFPEAARQAAVADVLAISKTDVAPFGPELAARLDALNPDALRVLAAAQSEPASTLFASVGSRPGERGGPAAPGTASAPRSGPRQDQDSRSTGNEEERAHAHHTHGVATYTVLLDAPVTRFEFARALGGLAQARGNDLLRVKGI